MRPIRAGRNFLKLTASPNQDFVPSPGGAEFFLRLTASLFFYFIGPRRSRRWGRLRPRPQTPAGPIFSYGRKDGKRPFKGAPAPLKIPRWGALWPRPQTPRPDSLVVGSSVLRANRYALHAEKILLFIKLYSYRTTVRQAVSPTSSAIGSKSSVCNLSLFRANRAGR